jgi:ASC-1-like (ASCH) protein
LTWIKDGIKTYEGRVYRGDWKLVKPGDIIKFHCNSEMAKAIEHITTVVSGILLFKHLAKYSKY